MQINPGGRLAAEHIIGRTREIERYWRVLDRQGLILGGERRLGKTHIVQKMHHDGRPGFVTFYQELEKVHSVLELVRELYAGIEANLKGSKRWKAKVIAGWSSLALGRIGALELPQAKDNWKALLRGALDDVLSVLEPGQKVVLIWDEFPFMLYNVKQREGAEAAMELLDVLRHARQTHGDQLRFLLTGSIGLHLVLRTLREAGNANDPTNDMHLETLPPMCDAEALDVAGRLLTCLDCQPADPEATAHAMVAGIGGFPYFLHHVADRLWQLDRPAGPTEVEAAIDALVDDDGDVAHFGYFVDRIRTYYRPDEARLAWLLLDLLSVQDDALPLPHVANLVRHAEPAISDDAIRSILSLLRMDHYLTMANGNYEFRWRVLKRWWRRSRR